MILFAVSAHRLRDTFNVPPASNLTTTRTHQSEARYDSAELTTPSDTQHSLARDRQA